MGQKEPELKRPCPRCGKDQIGTLAIAFDPDTGIYWHADGSGDNCQPQPPMAQVEVYRKALEEILGSCDGDLCADMNHHEIAREALLTSKPEPVAQGHDGNCVPVRTPDDGWKCDCGYAPVAPVRKWAKEDIIGHCGQCDADVEVHHTFAEVQDALNRKGGDEIG